MSGCALAIFVKTPGHSPVKTRLALSRGQPFAEEFHRRAAAAVAETARAAAESLHLRGGLLLPHWAIAEPDAMQAPQWQDLPRLGQGPGSLGERLAYVHRALLERAPAALLVGADSPQMTPALLIDACAWLEGSRPRCVMGRARDGGFWLFGSNRTFPDAAWASVAYSRSDTAAALVSAIGSTREVEWKQLPTLVDVDTGSDLGHLYGELGSIESPLPGQNGLRRWLLEPHAASDAAVNHNVVDRPGDIA